MTPDRKAGLPAVSRSRVRALRLISSAVALAFLAAALLWSLVFADIEALLHYYQDMALTGILGVWDAYHALRLVLVVIGLAWAGLAASLSFLLAVESRRPKGAPARVVRPTTPARVPAHRK